MARIWVCLGVFLFFQRHISSAQEFRVKQIPVKINGKSLQLPWLGGLNTPQIMNANVSLGADKASLVIFDRTGGVWLPFDYQGGKLIYLPELKKQLPKAREWVSMKDFNGDQLLDLFTFSSSPGLAGIDVYEAKSGPQGTGFDRVRFPNDRNDILYYSSGNSRINVYVSSIDYPAIEDVDLDGDVDVLSFETGGSQIIWYKNLAVDKNLPKGSFDMVIGDFCYGKILEDGFSERITLSANKDRCASGFSPTPEVRHSGSTILTFDRDNDKDMDLMIGDISSAGLIYLKNGGEPSKAWMNEEELKFPINSLSVDIPYFVSPFLADVNADGIKEFFAASNFNFGSDNYHCLWRYDADRSNPGNYTFRSNAFILDECIDFGENTYPALADIDGDGLTDLVVGSGGYFDRAGLHDAGLFLFKNTGSLKSPAFELIDTNWLGFRQFSVETNSFAPAFGDLDQDGDLDLVVGELLGHVYYVNNTAGKNKPMKFGPILKEYSNIDVGQYAAPQLYDLDRDGLTDLVIGERDGILNFFRNNGKSGAPLFSSVPAINALGMIDTRVAGFATGNASPFFLKSKTKEYLAVGTSGQDLLLYQDPKATSEKYSLIANNWGKILEGSETHPAVEDIDRDGFLDVIVGNQRGGLAWYSSDLVSDFNTSNQDEKATVYMSVSPNPVQNECTISFKGYQGHDGRLCLYDLQGRLVAERKWTGAVQVVDLSYLKNGIYIANIKLGDKQWNKRFMVHR